MEHAIFEAFTERLGRPVNFNLNSGPQLAAHLYDEAPDGLGLPVLKKTASGNRSVDAETLGKLAAQEPLVAWIVEMRQALKAKGTYFAPFPEHASETDEGLVLHPNYAQNGTETGRMSSQKPNVQNLPKGQVINGADSKTGESLVPGVGELQVNARDMIVARPDHYLVDMDWSQVEYRVIGGMSGDPALLQVFRDGIDLHVNTYAQMNGVDPSTVTKAQRAEGKTLNYALNFGAGPHRLAGMLNCSIGEAKQKIALYKQAFPHVADMKARIEEQARTKRWVNTVFGRKRWLNFGGENVDPDAANKAFHAALREAVNMPVQGTAADLLKITLVRLGPWLRDTYPGAHTLATTHDSITFEVPSSVPPEEFIAAVTPLCEFPEDFIAGYPAITCDFEVGDRWGSLSEMDASTSTPATSTTEDDVPEELPQTIRLGIHGTPSPSSIAAAGDLIRSMGSGPNRLVLQIGTSEFNDEHVVENTALGPNDGHLFAHLFDDYEYRPLGWEMAKATEGAA